MIESTVTLLATRGLQATAFSDVLERSGAPRGSIYHHFPHGKQELVQAAIELAGERAQRVMESARGQPPIAVTTLFVDLWRQVLVRSGLRAGCAVLAVTVATDSMDLLADAARIFRAWTAHLAELYVTGGLETEAATRLATMLISATEGAVVVARAEQSLEPFDLVASELLKLTDRFGEPPREPE